MRARTDSIEAAMGLPYGVRLRRIFGFYFIRPRDFRKVVAKSCYGLTHELVTTRLMESFTGFQFSGYTNSAWLELDKEMKAFTDAIDQEGRNDG
jgi:hypothetical protein